MLLKRFMSTLVTAATVIGMLGGCSGSGQRIGEVRGDTEQALASDTLTAALLLKRTLRALVEPTVQLSQYRAARGVAPSASSRVGRVIDECDRVWSQGNVHCIYYANGDSEELWTMTDGTSMHRRCSPTTPVGDDDSWFHSTMDRYSDGTTLSYDTTQYGRYLYGDDLRTGTITDPEEASIHFAFRRKPDLCTLSFQTDGGLTFEVALIPFSYDVFDITKRATGSLTSPSGTSTFKLTGDWVGGGWQRLEFSGLAGTPLSGVVSDFSVGPALEWGSGRIMRDGQLVGDLAWDGNVTGRMTLTGLATFAVHPAASAARFDFDGWLHSMAWLSPKPGN